MASKSAADPIRQLLRAWRAVEVLTPGKVEEGGWNAFAQTFRGELAHRDGGSENGRPYWEGPYDDDITPWAPSSAVPPCEELPASGGREEPRECEDGVDGAQPPEPAPAEAISAKRRVRRPWYKVVLGAMPAADAMQRLDAVFDDPADEDKIRRKEKGQVLAATLILDEFGTLVPDSLTIASFAWGVGALISNGNTADLSGWSDIEDLLIDEVSAWLSPTDSKGQLRPLLWSELRGASRGLQRKLGLSDDLWQIAPCAVRVLAYDTPAGDLLSTFYLTDITKVERGLPDLPSAVRAYLGIERPALRWDALNDRQRLSELLDPSFFPLARWPGPGLHPLSLLQQAAVNASVRDLAVDGLFAVNGPPGTGKTTLLRDIVAHVLVSRAQQLAAIDDPSKGVGDIDLMDYAIVVASNNNAAVENVSLELPVRKKALDASVWKGADLSYFAHTANHVLGLTPDAEEADQAWGLMAARLGSAKNRQAFFKRFWYDKDWGLNEWLDRVWSPHQRKFKGKEPSRLCTLDPPPTPHEAKARWQKARAEFHDALETCQRLQGQLVEIARSQDRRRTLESRRPGLIEEAAALEAEQLDAERALAIAEERCRDVRGMVANEQAALATLIEAKPGFVARLFGTQAWQHYQRMVGNRLEQGDLLRRTLKEAEARRDATATTGKTIKDRRRSACEALTRLDADLSATSAKLDGVSSDLKGCIPDAGFWTLSEEELQVAAPWNAGAFRSARDALFVAAVRLHRAFIAAGVRIVKPALNAIIDGDRNNPPTAEQWGLFFLLVPVVSTTFASLPRMFPALQGGSLGWLLLDEAGQACPQHALGAIWRARRAIVIGDPLQIPPVVPLGERTTAQLYANEGVNPDEWSAPNQSAQTLADRASRVQGRFPAVDGNPERPRITGFPLLVHRRCDDPMFAIANRIAYGNRMIHATAVGTSAIRDALGGSGWVDVDGSSKGKWVEDEGWVIDRAIRKLMENEGRLPDLYIISPFRDPVRNLKRLLLGRAGALNKIPDGGDWADGHVGTIHTFQGKEAESVILLLGAGRGAKDGSRVWAGQTPNMLNVAATRAKRSLYVVGNRELWKSAGFFADAARALPSIDAEGWFRSGKA